MKWVVALSAVLVIGCGKRGSTDSTAEKSLYSTWKLDSSDYYLDLSSLTFGVPYVFQLTDINHRVVCSCSFTATGTEASGSYTLSSCTYYSGSGYSDPGCSTLDGSGTFTHNKDLLVVCDSGGCASYH